ncbi:kinase-like protein [Xylaria sp. FL1042]|nr:kinase-like protein [Xylaria sp. FL1042]
MPEDREAREEGCFAITFERKYYHRGGSFIKRTLRPREFRTGSRGLHIPRLRKESIMNEAESLRYIRRHTNIPVPHVYCDFEDEDAYYLVTEYVEGVSMSRLTDDQKAVVCGEIQSHLTTLKTLTSNRLGGPSGIVIPPYRVLRRTELDHWHLKPSDQNEYVFCHNDLSQQNVIVDPDTLKINAIIDWEYAGFYPACFERPFYTRLGPSIAGIDEVDDSLELLEFLKSRSETKDETKSRSRQV